MEYLGILIGLGAAAAFAAAAALTLWGAARASRDEVARTFVADRPPPAARLLAWLSLWGPALLVALLGALAAVQIARVVMAALFVR